MADFESLKQMIINGDDAATAASQQLIDSGASARDILNEALLPGMDVVGDEMKSGEKFIPEVLLSARTMQACLDIIKPHLAAGESMSLGTVVIGTVEGDMHDIGKNLAAMLLSRAPASRSSTSARASLPPTSWPPSKSTSRRSSA